MKAGKRHQKQMKSEANNQHEARWKSNAGVRRRRALYVGVPKSHINCMLEKNDVVQAHLRVSRQPTKTCRAS
eukprot:1559349-Amphidinium_carterae.1